MHWTSVIISNFIWLFFNFALHKVFVLHVQQSIQNLITYTHCQEISFLQDNSSWRKLPTLITETSFLIHMVVVHALSLLENCALILIILITEGSSGEHFSGFWLLDSERTTINMKLLTQWKLRLCV